MISFLSSTVLGLLFTFLDCISYGRLLIPNHSNLSMVIFIYSTIVSQFLFTIFSSIKIGILAGPILENLVIIKTLYESILNLNNENVFAVQGTILCLILAALIFSLLSFVIVKYKLGKYVNMIPKSAIVGCLGAIGLCQFKIGIEGLTQFGENMGKPVKYIFMTTTILISIGAFVIQEYFYNTIYIIPLFTFVVIAVFYLITFLSDKISYMRRIHILTEKESINGNLFYNFTKECLNFNFYKLLLCAVQNIIPILNLVIMSLIHLPINLPIFCTKMVIPCNLTLEMYAQSIANIFTFIPSYFICSNSIFFNKAGATSKSHSLVFASSLFLLFFCKYVEAFIPTFIIAMFPFFIGFSITFSTLRDIKNRNMFDKFVVISASLIGLYKFEYSLLYGIMCNCLWFMNKSILSWSKNKKQKLDHENVVIIDFLACFASIELIKKRFEGMQKDIRLIVDMRNCGGMDWMAEDFLVDYISNYNDVVVVGNKIGKIYVNDEVGLKYLDLQ